MGAVQARRETHIRQRVLIFFAWTVDLFWISDPYVQSSHLVLCLGNLRSIAAGPTIGWAAERFELSAPLYYVGMIPVRESYVAFQHATPNVSICDSHLTRRREHVIRVLLMLHT